jgi:hypothetical protein
MAEYYDNCVICGKAVMLTSWDWETYYARWRTCSTACSHTTVPIPLEDLGMLEKGTYTNETLHSSADWTKPSMSEYRLLASFDPGKVQ